MVVIEPQGAGGGADRLLLGGSLDDPKRALASFDPATGKREDSNYFRDHTFTIDSGTTEPVAVKVEAKRVSEVFGLRVDYLYRGEERIVTTGSLGMLTGPVCDKKARLDYPQMVFAAEYSRDPLMLDVTRETPASMAKRMARIGRLC